MKTLTEPGTKKGGAYNQNKLKYMVEFQAAYFDLEKSIFNSTKEVIKRKVEKNEFDSLMLPKVDRFNSSHENVRFFISELQKPYFDRMSKNLSHYTKGLIEFNEDRDEWNIEDFKKKSEDLKWYRNLALRKMIKPSLEDIFNTYRQELEKDTFRERQLLKALKETDSK